MLHTLYIYFAALFETLSLSNISRPPSITQQVLANTIFGRQVARTGVKATSNTGAGRRAKREIALLSHSDSPGYPIDGSIIDDNRYQ